MWNRPSVVSHYKATFSRLKSTASRSKHYDKKVSLHLIKAISALEEQEYQPVHMQGTTSLPPEALLPEYKLVQRYEGPSCPLSVYMH